MGVSITCQKTGNSIDMGYGGFGRLRTKVASLINEDMGQHFAKLQQPSVYSLFLDKEARTKFFDSFNAYTQQQLAKHRWNPKIVDFMCQSDCCGCIHYGTCNMILKAIDGKDDGTIFGYAGHANPAKLQDFADICRECVENKCDLVWS